MLKTLSLDSALRVLETYSARNILAHSPKQKAASIPGWSVQRRVPHSRS